MRLNKLDYIIILKNLKSEFYKILDENSKMQVYAAVNAANAFNEMFPNEELPDYIKSIFKIANIRDITLYICDLIIDKKTPPASIIDLFFKNIDHNKHVLSDTRISDSSRAIIDTYLDLKFNLEDIDIRLFEGLFSAIDYYHILIKLNANIDNKKIERILNMPVDLNMFNSAGFLVLLKRVFEGYYDGLEGQKSKEQLFFEKIKNAGILDKWIKHAVNVLNLTKALQIGIMSLGVAYEDLPELLKDKPKLKKESFSFKSYFMR
jgi:hypothetical protein